MRTPILAALLAALALAPAAARGQVKLGFVDLPRALNEVEEGKAAKAQLEKEFKEKQKQLDAKQDELRKLKAEYDKQAVVMSDQAKRDKQAELERKAGETQQLFVQLQSELSRREQELTGPILEKLGNAVREIAEAEGFTAIFERNRSGVVYMTAALDVTNEVIRKYNTRPPAKKAEPAKPAAPAAAPAKK
ncbi:MAG TPA: OmpH family outer membrane protein [Anaeromyxobacteraceae bacterium]|nr:OmpH family outer membrane protein [Anaeromyxobacteraceae bacterium]